VTGPQALQFLPRKPGLLQEFRGHSIHLLEADYFGRLVRRARHHKEIGSKPLLEPDPRPEAWALGIPPIRLEDWVRC
jgi:hypothetical protein